jgi:oxepin-CoA hydrolase/3-oxo-5,6-dehydrosuberyl-CoA semialdehyde dehydrogenase
MNVLPFDVNDLDIRESFLYIHLMVILEDLTERHSPAWGRMSALQMVEHLTRSFEISTGNGEVVVPIQAQLVERRKKFLYTNIPTPQEVPNPLLSDGKFSYRIKNLYEGREGLSAALNRFREELRHNPEAEHYHPIFGWLNMVEWERAHYKHSYHHLLQFELIQPGLKESQ